MILYECISMVGPKCVQRWLQPRRIVSGVTHRCTRRSARPRPPGPRALSTRPWGCAWGTVYKALSTCVHCLFMLLSVSGVLIVVNKPLLLTFFLIEWHVFLIYVYCSPITSTTLHWGLDILHCLMCWDETWQFNFLDVIVKCSILVNDDCYTCT